MPLSIGAKLALHEFVAAIAEAVLGESRRMLTSHSQHAQWNA
jgi:hypothetical protein